MSAKETHYNRKEQPASEDNGKEKSAGRKRQQLSPERAKDKAKKNHKEKSAQPDEKRERAYKPKSSGTGNERSFGKREDKPFGQRGERDENRAERKPFRSQEGGEGKRPYPKREDKPFEGRGERDENRSGEKRTFRPRNEEQNEGRRPSYPKRDGQRDDRKPADRSGSRPDSRRDDGDKPFKKYVPFEDRKDKTTRPDDGGKKSFGDRKRTGDKPFGRSDDKRKGKFDEPEEKEQKPKNPFEGEDFYEDERPFTRSRKWDQQAKEGPMTLNKYLAHSGISSRREAASIVKEGKIKVNGAVMLEPGYRVKEGDEITFDDKVMKPQKNLVYILLNKPKGFITTTEDEKGRRTVMELVANAETDRIYPIGRLDRNTTGVLLMTNDGDLTQKLSHPSYNCKKIYQVTLTEPLTKRDFDKITAGITLEDGPAPVDALAYLEKKNEIGIEIHSGKNRIVRRIFESLGYVVDKLDRVVFAGLTKKNVSRGKWRFLTEKEVINLKHFNS